MPNGGVPLWQVIRPIDSPVTIMAKGAEISIFATEDWDRDNSQATLLVVLSTEQAQHLARHLDYWFGGIRGHNVGLESRDGTVVYDL